MICLHDIYFLSCPIVTISDADIHRLAERAGTFISNNIQILEREEMSKQFPNVTELDVHTEPTVIVDQADNMILWYLPNAVSGPNQVSSRL